jgi:hypothetical protein
MPTEEEQYWEQEYAEFEDRFFSQKAFWRVPAHALKGTPLFAVFERLCATFPDHPGEHNTVFYLFEHRNISPKSYSVLLRCSHFEHTSLDDIRMLVEFLESAAAIITTHSCALLEHLDGCAEKLHLRFYGPRDEIVTLLQSRSSRSTA